MPVEEFYTCDVCERSVNDSDLLADATLRRIHLASATSARAVEGTPSVVVQQQAGDRYFCGKAHLETWLEASLI